MPTAVLTDRATLTVTGADAVDLLQRLVTCDVEGMPEGEARLGALLAPQGKILFDFLVSRTEGGFRLDLPASMRADLLKRLTLYKLRAKVDLREETGAVVAAWDEAVRPVDVRDGRLPALGARRYGAADRDGPESAWEAHRIGFGIPEGGRDFAYGDAFPHEALMDQLGGVDFRKGCYVGQEVVSRMQHRGTARTRILPVTYPDGEAAVPGTEVVAGGKTLGRTGSTAGTRGLAMLRLDRLAEAQASGASVSAGGHALQATVPAFATFRLTEPAATPVA